MATADALWLAAAGAAVWFWLDSLRARERAIGLCGASCRARGVQLLDQTVAMFRLGVGRAPNGTLRLRRRYRFEFTRDGAARDAGTIVMLGSWMESLEMPEDGSRIYEHGEF